MNSREKFEKESKMNKLSINPVYINHDTIAVIHLFTNSSDFIKRIQTSDLIGENENDYNIIYHESAKRYIDALEGNECDYFLTALIDECKKRLDKGDK